MRRYLITFLIVIFAILSSKYVSAQIKNNGAIGSVTIDGKIWNQVAMRPLVPIGKFVVAFDLASGEESWKTMRDEPPSWGSPTVYRDATHEVLITNGSTYSRGYNPRTGEELWRLGGHSAITVPTPFVAQGLIYLLDGYRPFQPVYAVKLGARGDITLGPNQTSSSDVA